MRSRLDVVFQCDVNRVTARWSDLEQDVPASLSRTASISVAHGTRRVNECLASLQRLSREELESIGRWLHAGMGRTRGIGPDTDVFLRFAARGHAQGINDLLHRQMVSLVALPWHLAADDRGYLAHYGIHLYPQPVHHARPIYEPFSRPFRVHLVLPMAGVEAPLWLDAVGGGESDVGAQFALRPPRCYEAMKHADVVYLPVRSDETDPFVLSEIKVREADQGAGSGYVSLDLVEMIKAIAPLPPKVLMLGTPDAPSDALMHRAAFLAEFIPTVVVVPDPPSPSSLDDRLPGRGARLFLQLLVDDGLEPADAVREMRRQTLDVLYQAICFENRAQRKHVPLTVTPPALDELARPWRYRLDRVEQSRAALGGLETARSGVSPQKGAVLLFHGDRESGLRPFNERLVRQLSLDREVVALNMMWPGGSFLDGHDLCGALLGAMMCPVEDLEKYEPGEVVRRNREAMFPGDRPRPDLMFIFHNALRGRDLSERFPLDVLLEYLERWDAEILPALPGETLSVMTLSFEGSGSEAWAKELHRGIEESSFMRLSKALPVAHFGRVPEADLAQAVELIGETRNWSVSPRTTQSMSDAVFDATRGVFLRCASVLDGMPLNWREWKRRSRVLKTETSEVSHEIEGRSHPERGGPRRRR